MISSPHLLQLEQDVVHGGVGVAGHQDAVAPGNQYAHQVGYGSALSGARHPKDEGVVSSREGPAIV